jgi:hypothetical protein
MSKLKQGEFIWLADDGDGVQDRKAKRPIAGDQDGGLGRVGPDPFGPPSPSRLGI